MQQEFVIWYISIRLYLLINLWWWKTLINQSIPWPDVISIFENAWFIRFFIINLFKKRYKWFIQIKLRTLVASNMSHWITNYGLGFTVEFSIRQKLTTILKILNHNIYRIEAIKHHPQKYLKWKGEGSRRRELLMVFWISPLRGAQ